jgi:hypothetical protein
VRDSIVTAENRRAGTASWLPQSVRYEPGTDFGQWLSEGRGAVNWLGTGRSTRIEGWCSHTSVLAGDTVTLYANTQPATDLTFDVYRLGYYGGLGARLVSSFGPLPGIEQPKPRLSEGRLYECEWLPNHEFVVPDDWVSGVYLGKLTRTDDATEGYVIFVVRDQRQADVIAQTSDFSWQAYNRWPHDACLYSDGIDVISYYGADVNVSFDRPYLEKNFQPLLPGTGRYFVFEFPFTYWLEREGYDVTYVSNVDTHRGTAGFDRASAFLSIGHDEYWTPDIYDHLMAARESGLSIGFFCGNSACVAIDLRASTSGRAERVFSRKDLFGHKVGLRQAVEPAPGDVQYNQEEFRELFPYPLQMPDEGELMGARNVWPVQGSGHWVCTDPDHWIYAGTGMGAGDAIPNLVGHEWHGVPAEIEGLEVVSTGPTYDDALGYGEYAATVYPATRGNLVFNASSTWWASALALPPGFQRQSFCGMPSPLPDARVQRMTKNVLDRLIETGHR